MPHKAGTCTGHYELLEVIRRLSMGYGEQGTITADGGNTGNGTTSRVDLDSAGSGELWTVTCSDDTTAGEEIWSVVGSVSGTVSTNYITGTEFDYTKVAFKLTSGGTNFAAGDKFYIDSGDFTGTGNGTLGSVETKGGSVTEAFTLTVTSASAGSDTWSVVGSVTGALASATTGVPYTSAGIDFLITNGGTNFSVSDSFVIEVRQSDLSAASQEWIDIDSDLVSDDRRLVLQGPGLDGTKIILARFDTSQDVLGDYYNIGVRYYTAYTSDAINTGESTQKWFPAYQLPLDYWVVVNGQRIFVGAAIEGTSFMSMYVGFYNSYSTPTSFPYPIIVSGMENATSTSRFSTATLQFSFKSTSNAQIRAINGSNQTPDLWPYSTWHRVNTYLSGTPVTPMYYTLQDTGGLGGAVPMLPIVVKYDGVQGEFDGVYATRGVSQVWQNIIKDGTYDYLVGRNYTLTGFKDYIAIRLD